VVNIDEKGSIGGGVAKNKKATKNMSNAL